MEKMLRYNEDGAITNLMTPKEENALMERIIKKNAYQDGLKKGMKTGTKDIAISMMKEGIPIETISKVTKLSIKELEKLVVKNKD